MHDTDNFLSVINNFLSGTKFGGVSTKDAKWNNSTGIWNIWRVSTYWKPISAWRLHIIMRTRSRSEHHRQAVLLCQLSALWANKGEVSQFWKRWVSLSHAVDLRFKKIMSLKFCYNVFLLVQMFCYGKCPEYFVLLVRALYWGFSVLIFGFFQVPSLFLYMVVQNNCSMVPGELFCLNYNVTLLLSCT